MYMLSHVWLFAISWTVACQVPLSMGFPRQEYWSGLPFPPPGDLPNPGIEPSSPVVPSCQADSYHWATWETHLTDWLFSRSAVSDSLRPHGLQHARLPCPPSSRACSNSCPLSRWYHPTVSSSVVPFSSCLQSFPAPRSFLMSWLFVSGGQNIGASVSASILPVNI